MAMNMGYCRFENTFMALKECEEALGDIGWNLDELSEAERKSAVKLLDLCQDLASNLVEG